MFRKVSFARVCLVLALPVLILGSRAKLFAKEDHIYKHSSGLKIKYSDCLVADENSEDDSITFLPSSSCVDQYIVGDGLSVAINPYTGYKNLEAFARATEPAHPVVRKEDHMFGKTKGMLLVTVQPEADPLIDRKDQANYDWTAAVFCGKTFVTVGWSDHLDKTEREKMRKSSVEPKAFREVVNGLSCP